jgi:hypothetical protein
VRVALNNSPEPPVAQFSGDSYFSFTTDGGNGSTLNATQEIGHVLNRVAYGPTFSDIALVQQIGVSEYLEQQLDPSSIDESDNVRLLTKEDELFELFQPANEIMMIAKGEDWKYYKGTSEPPSNWNDISFNDTLWFTGPTGIG